MRRLTHPSHVVAFIAFFAAVMAVGVLLKDAITRPSLQDVRAAVLRGPTMDAAEAARLALDGIDLPDWAADHWTLTGARTDLLEDGRDAITGFYRRGDATIALSVIDGTGLDDNERTITVRRYAAGRETTLTLGGATAGARPSLAGFGSSQVSIGSGLDCADGCVGPPLRPVLSARHDVRGHAVVLTAWPVNDRVYGELGAMALRVEGDA